jgi:hypothetical protein
MNNTNKHKTFKSAKVVQYKGGGYDGCHWEWNYALIVDGAFHDVLSSGRNAIKDKESLLEYIKSGKTYYSYNLNKKSDILEFTKETNETTQGMVIAEVNRILDSKVMFFTCTYCENKIYAKNDMPNDSSYPQFFHDDQAYQGNGGIGIVFTTILCEDCYCNTCEDCNSIFAPNDESFTTNYDRRVCQYCKDDDDKPNGKE